MFRNPAPYVVAFVLTVYSGRLSASDEDASSCKGRGTSVVVNLEKHALSLCNGELAVREYPVAIGRGGIGKTREGDKKTPVGAYPLGTPRPSSKFGVFIPVGYPTAAQRRDGYTGSAIGIHGPSRASAWAGRMNVAVDWTEGCIAVSSDDVIRDIAAWVRKNKPRLVYLEGDERTGIGDAPR